MEGRAGSGSGRGVKLQCGFREGLSQHDIEILHPGVWRSGLHTDRVVCQFLVLPLEEGLEAVVYLVIGCQLACEGT